MLWADESSILARAALDPRIASDTFTVWFSIRSH